MLNVIAFISSIKYQYQIGLSDFFHLNFQIVLTVDPFIPMVHVIEDDHCDFVIPYLRGKDSKKIIKFR